MSDGPKCFVLAQTYAIFEEHALTETIEAIRAEFLVYKLGNEFEHAWFCHDVGADPQKYLRHVHLIPTNPAKRGDSVSRL